MFGMPYVNDKWLALIRARWLLVECIISYFYESVQNIRPFSHCHRFNNNIPALVFLYLLA